MKSQYRYWSICQGLLLGLVAGACASYTYANPVGYVLKVELSPAVCKIDSSQKRTRQCLEGYSLSVAGLYPQHAAPQNCETSSLWALTPVQKRVLMRIMPDENSQARLWRQVGGCVAMNANQYFRLMVNYAERLNMPEELSSPTTLRMNKEWLQQRLIKQNKGLTEQNFQLSCARSDSRSNLFLTTIKVCYQNNGRYKTCQAESQGACPEQFMIQGSY